MGKDGAQGKSGGLASTLVTAILILGAVGYLGYKLLGPTNDPIYQRQDTPEHALKVYLEVAEKFTTGQEQSFEKIRKVVTEADYRWFQDNKDRIFQEEDHFNISSGIDPGQATAMASLSVMKEMLDIGPNRSYSPIIDQEIQGDHARLVVRKKESYSSGNVYYVDVRVKLRREGKYWKVVDFAGGRAVLENRDAPDDFVRRTQAEVEGGKPSPAGEVARAQPAEEKTAVAASTQPLALSPSAPTTQSAITTSGVETAVPAAADPARLSAAALAQADLFVNEARSLWQVGRHVDAYKTAYEAYKLRSQHLPKGHPDIVEVQELARNLYTAIKEIEAAEAVRAEIAQ